jgi:glycine dehydrogenase subunit 2
MTTQLVRLEEPRLSRPTAATGEPLLKELSVPGRGTDYLPPLDVPEGNEFFRARADIGLPEVSEIDVVRHFSRLSTMNMGIDTNMYPLGSCTM